MRAEPAGTDDRRLVTKRRHAGIPRRLAEHGLHPWVLAAVLAAIVVVAVPAVPVEARSWVVWLAFGALHVSFCRDAWAVWRDPGSGRPTQVLWGTFLVAVALFAIGDALQLVALATQPWSYEVAVGQAPQQALLLAGMSVVLVVVVVYPLRLGSLRASARFWLDVGVVVLAVAVATLALEPLPVAEDRGAAVASLLTEPVLFAVVALAVAKLLRSAERPFTRAAGVVLGLAALGEALLSALTVRSDLAENLSLVNGLALASNALLALAARVQRSGPATRPAPAERRAARMTVLPPVAVVTTHALLVATLAREGLTPRAWLMLGAALVSTTFVLARQLVALSEKSVLLRRLHAALDERDELTARLAHLAYHDALTGLANRAQFEAAVADAVRALRGRPARRGHDELSVVVLDLDGFKEINDTHGHAAGDHVLAAVAERLRSCVRDGDLVARFGGDEFSLMLSRPAADAEAVARRVVAAIAEPFEIPGHSVRIGASVGVVTAEDDAWSGDELLRRADVAMYRAKAAGKGRVVVDVGALA